jgi:hypothetical protein
MARYDWPAPPRGEDDPVGRGRHLAVLRPIVDPTTIAPLKPRARRRGRAASAPIGDAPAGNQNLWFPIGPSVMTNGQAGGNPNVAGRIRDVQIEPTNGLRIYAASGTGGAWFSADRGETWVPLDDFQASDRTDVGNVASALACGAVYVKFGAAADGSQDEVWVGTGEPSLTQGGLSAVTGAGPGGGLPGGQLAGIGFLHRDPAVGPAWTVVKGDAASADPDTLRGGMCYRIAADPGNPDQLVAGTTNGLYLLAPGGSWTRVTTYPMSFGMDPLDVVLTRLTGPDRVRIWVGVPSGVRVAEFAGSPATAITPASLSFTTAVALPNVQATAAPGVGGTRVELATDGSKVYVLGRRAIAAGDQRSTPPADLWSIDATAALGSLSATEITGVPPDLFMSAGDQSDYDMCIAAHPSMAGLIYVGGAAISTSTGWNGSIYRCQIAGTAATPTLIGEGVHPDVHVLRVGPAAPSQPTMRTVWVGCDGGLFRSDSDGDAGTFANRNDGLAVLQPGYVASHPTNPGIVAAGFQDNGTAIRTGDGLWEQRFAGDGGGIVFDPASDNRYFRQYTQATWQSSDGRGTAPVHRRNARAQGTLKTSETIESDSSLFYSGADAVALGGDVHLAFGSDRVWYTRDWGGSWVTLPTATDPRAGDNPNLGQDVLQTVGTPGTFSDRVGSTDSCASTYVGTAISGSGIVAVKFAVAPNDSAGNLVLRVLALYPSGLVWFTGTRAPEATGAFAWATTTPFVQQAIRDPNPGAEETDASAGNPLAFVPAPGRVSDVAVHDPARGTFGSCYVTTTGDSIPISSGPNVQRDTLWFFDGTDKWYPTGLRITHPNGTWGGTPPSNIRVTAPGLGVVVDPDDRSKVYVGTSVGVVKGTLTIGGTPAAPTYAWAWEQFVNGLPEAAVQDLSIRKYGGVSLLRVALQSRGVWETDIGNSTASPLTYLRLYRTDTRRVLPTPTSGPLLAGDQSPVIYDNSPDIVIDTTGTVRTVPPTESDLLKIPPAGAAAAQAQVSITERHPQVHVLVHHRWSDAAPPAQVRVALMRHAMPASGSVALGGLWTALVGAATSGTPPASLPDGWSQAGAALWQNPAGPVEPRLPRAVTFALDLSGDASGTAILLLAVVMSDSNQISAADLQLTSSSQATTADQLVLSSPHVAAKSIVIR